MPYLKQVDKNHFEKLDNAIRGAVINSAGDLNYLFTRILQQYLRLSNESYSNYNSIIGALECCKLELYRRMISQYEDTKIEENGDVYE